MNETPQKKILDVGCGWNKTPGAIGMDANPKSHADVIHDLGEFLIHSRTANSTKSSARTSPNMCPK